MKKLFSTLLCLVFLVHLSGQEVSSYTTEQSILNDKIFHNVNLGVGPVSFLSLNYELLIGISENSFVIPKIGIGFVREFEVCWNSICENNYRSSIPHGITWAFGKTKHKFEIGIQGNLIRGTEYELFPLVGYRFFPDDRKKLNFRIALGTPEFSFSVDTYIYPYLSFHVGKIF